MSTAVQPLMTIGHVTPRVDAIERVTGQARYTNDLKLPGMLYARVLRSPHPHARIRHIDTSAASRLPGSRSATKIGLSVRARANCSPIMPTPPRPTISRGPTRRWGRAFLMAP